MAFNPQNIFKVRELVISDKKQNAFGAAIGDAELIRRLRFEQGDYITRKASFRSDKDKVGKGHSFPTYRVKTDWDVSFGPSFDVDDFLAGWIAAFVMGADAVTGAGPYTHTITFQQSSGQATVTTVYMEDTAALKAKFIDMAISDVEFSGTGRGVVSAKLNMVGGGKKVDGAIAALPALPTIKEVLASDVSFLIGPQGAPVAIDQARLVSWTIRISQDLEVKKRPGSTLYATDLSIGQPQASLSLVIAASDVDDFQTLVENDTLQEVQLNINSGADCQLKFKFPGVYLSNSQIATDGKEVVYQVESDQDSILKSGVNEPLIVTVINSQPTYLTAAA